jgi:hypothetical protein
MPCAVPTRRDGPERTIPKNINGLPKRRHINALGKINLLQFIDTRQMIALHEEPEVDIAFILPDHIRNVLGQIDNPSRMIHMQVGQENAFS